MTSDLGYCLDWKCTSLRNKKLRGNHYVDFVVDVPTSVTKEQKKLLQQLEETFDGKLGKKFKRK